MAESLLAEQVAHAGMAARASVSSAAVMDRPARPASELAIATLRARGIDLSGHASRPLSAAIVGRADLVLTMERAHLRAAAVLVPGGLAKTFTVKEFVRRGLVTGPRQGPLEHWLARVNDGRDPAELLGEDPADEVADPVGGTRADFEQTAASLDLLCRGIVYLLFSHPA